MEYCVMKLNNPQQHVISLGVAIQAIHNVFLQYQTKQKSQRSLEYIRTAMKSNTLFPRSPPECDFLLGRYTRLNAALANGTHTT
jgi:hypothetical protein